MRRFVGKVRSSATIGLVPRPAEAEVQPRRQQPLAAGLLGVVGGRRRTGTAAVGGEFLTALGGYVLAAEQTHAETKPCSGKPSALLSTELLDSTHTEGTLDRKPKHGLNSRFGGAVDFQADAPSIRGFRKVEKEAAIKKFSTKVRIYWSDCDTAGIVYYGNFFRLFEIAEEELFHALGRSRIEVFREHGVGFPRVEVWSRFRIPIREGDLVEITTWITKRTTTGLVFNLEMRVDGHSEVAAEAHYRVVCVKRPEFKPVPLPPGILHLLRDYLPPLSKHTPEHKA